MFVRSKLSFAPPVSCPAMLALTFLVGCPADVASPNVGAPTAASPEAPKSAQPSSVAEASPGPDAPPKQQRAKVHTDVSLPLPSMLGKSPPEVEALLDEPLVKGRTRESCVRFVPERTWFACSWVWQRYGDKTQTFAAIEIIYEDGIATGAAFEGLPGAGKFEVDQALRHVGLELGGSPRVTEPETGVQVWEWFNDQARLSIGKAQYRVRLSVRDGDWTTSKLEVIENSPLSPEQQAKIKVAKSPAESAESAESADAADPADPG